MARPLCINRYLDGRWLKSQRDLLGQSGAGGSNDGLLVGTSKPETKLHNAKESIKTNNLAQTLKIEIPKAQHQSFFLTVNLLFPGIVFQLLFLPYICISAGHFW